jgi:hypothetical protein
MPIDREQLGRLRGTEPNGADNPIVMSSGSCNELQTTQEFG